MFSRLRPWLPDHRNALTALYITHSLRNFGLSLIGIFVPVYIFQTTGSFYWLPAYIVVLSASVLITTFPLAALQKKRGIFQSIFVSNLLLLGYLGALLWAPNFFPAFLLAAVFEGVQIPCYWLPYHFIYSKEGKAGFFGRQVGLMGIFTSLLSFPAPFLGGLIIAVFGFPALYLLGIAILLLSSIPLAVDGDHLKIEDFSFRNVLNDAAKKENRPIVLGFFGLRADALIAGFLVWPIFIFTIAQSFATLGAITSALALVPILFALPIAPLVDKLGLKKSFVIGSADASVFWLVVGFLSNIWAISGLLVLRSAIGPFYWITADAATYILAQSRKIYEFVLLRELSLHFGGLITAVVVTALWAFFGANWVVLFIPGAIGAAMAALLAYSSNKKSEVHKSISLEDI